MSSDLSVVNAILSKLSQSLVYQNDFGINLCLFILSNRRVTKHCDQTNVCIFNYFIYVIVSPSLLLNIAFHDNSKSISSLPLT